MNDRIIKIEFDDSNYTVDPGTDVLLKVSSPTDDDTFDTISTYSYDYYDKGDNKDADDVTEECLNQFKEALKKKK